jgi:hypothetical protein
MGSYDNKQMILKWENLLAPFLDERELDENPSSFFCIAIMKNPSDMTAVT